MKRFLYLFSLFFLFTTISISAQAQNTTGRRSEMAPELRRQALVIEIESRVLAGQTVVWNEINSKEAIPGSPVGIQLVGSNLILAVQFTPFVRRDTNNVLVAHSQIWIANPDNTVTYFTSIQTIPIEFGEKIHFFPLGSSDQTNSSIEIIITVTSNRDGGGPRRTNVGNER